MNLLREAISIIGKWLCMNEAKEVMKMSIKSLNAKHANRSRERSWMEESEPMNDDNFIIDMLTYRLYEWNRKTNPQIDPKRWNLIFPNSEQFDIIYKKQNLLEKSK